MGFGNRKCYAMGTAWEHHGNIVKIKRSSRTSLFNASSLGVGDFLVNVDGPQHNPVYPGPIVKLLGSFDSLGFSSGFFLVRWHLPRGFWMV